MYRCPACRTRRSSYKLFTQHLRATGHKVCTCGGYHYAHRPGSPCCEQNPSCDLHQALRRGDKQDVLMEIMAHIAWETKGKIAGHECPF